MSHFDPIEPNVLIPLMPTVFLYSAARLRTDLCRFTPLTTPHTSSSIIEHMREFLTKDFLRQIIHSYVHKTTCQCHQIFNLFTFANEFKSS
jgi:hypothetical protein